MPSRESIEGQLLTRKKPEGWSAPAVLPDYAGYSINGVAALVERLFGLKTGETPLTALASDLEGFRHVVLLVIDGLGYRKLESAFARFPDLALRELSRRGIYLPLTSVFPATTVAAVVSISTGQTPLEHGLIGYRLYLRETSAITNMIRYAMVGNGQSGAAFGAGLEVDSLVVGSTLHQRLAPTGVSVRTLLPQHIAGSGLSVALYKGSSVHAAASLSDMLVTARELLARATERTFLFLYWPNLDTVEHARGPESGAATAELRAIDDALRRELIGQSPETLLIVMADHGFVAMGPRDYVRIHDDPDMARALLLPPVGEPRASYLFVREGEKERLSEALSRLNDGLICVDSQALLEDGLLGEGPPHPEISARVGDLAVVSTGRAGLFHPYHDAALLLGMHGGLTEEEMLVPLILSPL